MTLRELLIHIDNCVDINEKNQFLDRRIVVERYDGECTLDHYTTDICAVEVDDKQIKLIEGDFIEGYRK